MHTKYVIRFLLGKIYGKFTFNFYHYKVNLKTLYNLAILKFNLSYIKILFICMISYIFKIKKNKKKKYKGILVILDCPVFRVLQLFLSKKIFRPRNWNAIKRRRVKLCKEMKLGFS